MRSSPPSASSGLELVAVTVADRAACALVVAAGAFVAAESTRRGMPAAAAVAGLLAFATAWLQWRRWTVSSRNSPAVLHCLADGRLQVRGAGPSPIAATLGPRTRLLGPSVFLDVHYAISGRVLRYRKWLTPWDLPAGALRRWAVVLPACGRVARS